MAEWYDPETGITWTYTVSGGEASVGSGEYDGARAVPTSTTGAITIPSTLGGCPVTSIGEGAFSGCSGLKTVYVDAGDKARVKMMIKDSRSGLSGVEYVVVGECLVKFVAGDGAGTMADMDCAPGKVYKLTKNAFTCDGKRFAGWMGSDGKRYDDEMLVFDLGKAGEVLTLTAIWE